MPPVVPVFLRPFAATDIPFFSRLATDERVIRHVGSGEPWLPERIEVRCSQALAMDPVDAEGACRWFIAQTEGKSAGLLVATGHSGNVEIGYWVAPEFWGRGIAGAMIDRGLTMLPELFNANYLTARAAVDNLASLKLLERRGFMRESVEQETALYSRAASSSTARVSGSR